VSTRLQRLARRLWDGSAVLARRRADAVAAWVRRGRRDDLSGLAAALGCILRALLVLLGLYLLWRLIRAFPNLLWGIVPLWCWRALRAAASIGTSPELPDESGAETNPASPEEVLTATLEWIHHQVADRNGIHLAELLAHAHAHGLFADLDVAAFRTVLEGWQIPVRQQIKVAGRNRPGIHRDDLPQAPARTPSPSHAQDHLPAPSTAA
jgi:hypothetical protein